MARGAGIVNWLDSVTIKVLNAAEFIRRRITGSIAMKKALKILGCIVGAILLIMLIAFLWLYWLVCSHPTHLGGC